MYSIILDQLHIPCWTCWPADLSICGNIINTMSLIILILILGYAYDPDCMYINGSGRDYYEFYIQLNRCGTLGKNANGEDSRKNPTVTEMNI